MPSESCDDCWIVAVCCVIQACALASARLDGHWALGGEVQKGLSAAITGAREAAQAAQATRRKAQLLAARLDAAALIIDSGSKSAQMKVVAHELHSFDLHN